MFSTKMVQNNLNTIMLNYIRINLINHETEINSDINEQLYYFIIPNENITKYYIILI